MESLVKKLEVLGASVITGVLGDYVTLFMIVCGMIAFDVITGIAKANVLGNVSSSKGTQGLWKKLSILLAVVFGMFLQYVIGVVALIVEVPTLAKVPIAGAIAAYVIFNEAISVCENFYAINPNMLPSWVANRLKTAKETLDTLDQK